MLQSGLEIILYDPQDIISPSWYLLNTCVLVCLLITIPHDLLRRTISLL